MLIDIKGTVRKNERGYRMKPENLRSWTIHIRHLSHVSEYLLKMQNKKYYNGIKPEILWFLCDKIVFRLFAYFQNKKCLNLQLLCKIKYIFRFSYNFTQFDINFSRQENQIDVLYVLFNSWDSQVLAYISPFIFPLQSL